MTPDEYMAVVRNHFGLRPTSHAIGNTIVCRTRDDTVQCIRNPNSLTFEQRPAELKNLASAMGVDEPIFC